MKTLIWIFSFLTIVTLSSMQQTTDVKGLLGKLETRKEIFSAILNNPQMMTEFMQEMHNNRNAMMMFYGNNNAAAGNEQYGKGEIPVMSRSQMYELMKNNPAMLRTMMGNMISVVSSDTTLSREMINMMYNNNGMMNYMGHMYNGNGGMNPGYGMGMMNYRNR